MDKTVWLDLMDGGTWGVLDVPVVEAYEDVDGPKERRDDELGTSGLSVSTCDRAGEGVVVEDDGKIFHEIHPVGVIQ